MLTWLTTLASALYTWQSWMHSLNCWPVGKKVHSQCLSAQILIGKIATLRKKSCPGYILVCQTCEYGMVSSNQRADDWCLETRSTRHCTKNIHFNSRHATYSQVTSMPLAPFDVTNKYFSLFAHQLYGCTIRRGRSKGHMCKRRGILYQEEH